MHLKNNAWSIFLKKIMNKRICLKTMFGCLIEQLFKKTRQKSGKSPFLRSTKAKLKMIADKI